jgi:serine/threonine protein kinase
MNSQARRNTQLLNINTLLTNGIATNTLYRGVKRTNKRKYININPNTYNSNSSNNMRVGIGGLTGMGGLPSMGGLSGLTGLPGLPENDLKKINSILNSNISSKYKIIKYLGEGIQGSLYLAIDDKQKKYIYKNIILKDDEQNDEQGAPYNNNASKQEKYNQLTFELNVLKYLSDNASTREHINPCLEYKIAKNNVYTIFPIFDGYSLEHFKNNLSRLNYTEYYKLIFHLIKTILYGMEKIHKTNIAHQNINENSILVSSNASPNELFVKFTDFGLGCGHIAGKSNILNINDYQNDKFFNLASCKKYNNVPVVISNDIMGQLSESEYLQISQKYDLLCLGLIFIKILLFFDKLDIDLSKGYNNLLIENVKQYIIDKYMQQNKQNNRQSKLFPLDKTGKNIPDDIQKEILQYLKLIITHILCNTNSRKTCQYILDKIIIYEKYKND